MYPCSINHSLVFFTSIGEYEFSITKVEYVDGNEYHVLIRSSDCFTLLDRCYERLCVAKRCVNSWIKSAIKEGNK